MKQSKKQQNQNVEQLFRDLYLQYSGKVYNFILQQSNGNSYLAEEVMQTSFLKVWEHRDSLTSMELLQPYLFSTVRNIFLNHCKHEAVRFAYERYLKDNFSELTSENIGAQVDANALQTTIEQLIAELPPRQQEVFYKSRIEQKSYKDIAEEMHISEKTVGVQISSTLKYLKEHLGGTIN